MACQGHPLPLVIQASRPVTAANTANAASAAAVGILDQLLRDAAVPARLALDDGGVRWDWDAGNHPTCVRR